MPIFRYKAHTKKGKVKSGIDIGLNEADLVARFRRKELEIFSLVPAEDDLETKIKLFVERSNTKDLVIFSRQFSVMISANVPVVESLLILIEQTENFSLKNMIADIAFEVDAGSLLSDSFEKRPEVFSNFFVNIIRSGETSGKLDEVLNYLADEMEKSYDMASKVKGAMIYPIFILVGLIGVAIVLMVYVIPNLTSVLTESGAELPFATRVVIGTSNFLTKYLLLLFLACVGLAFLARLYLKTYNGQRNLDIVKLRMPIFGTLFKYIYLMRFTRSLSTLLKGGVTITKSLEIVADVVSNVIYKEIILATLESINDGNPLSTVMENEPTIPKMVPQMLAVGERTGKIDVVLDKITEFYSREADKMLANLSTLMEPVIMTVMGIGVGIMVAAVIMPMYNMASQF
ncbi:MAG: type II secretion system F family protein [Candidatus Falkowbacteria bacterium]